MTSDHPTTPPQQPLEGPVIAENPLPSVDTHTPEKPRRQQRRKRGPKKPVATTNAANEGDAPAKPAETSPRKPRRRQYRKPKPAADANKEGVVEVTSVVEKQEGNVAEVAQDKTDGEASQQKKRRFFRRRGPKRASQQSQLNGEEQTKEATAGTEGSIMDPIEGTKKVQRPRREIPFNRRVFGRYECVDCEHKWTSANSWRGKKQGCKLCSNMVEATELRFLFHRKPRSPTQDYTATPVQDGQINVDGQNTTEELKNEEISEKKTDTDNNVVVEGEEQEDVKPRLPHPSHLCEMCLSLGHSCRDRLDKKAEETDTTETKSEKTEEVEKTNEEVEKKEGDVVISSSEEASST